MIEVKTFDCLAIKKTSGLSWLHFISVYYMLYYSLERILEKAYDTLLIYSMCFPQTPLKR